MNVKCWVGALVCVSSLAWAATASAQQGGDKLVWKAFDIIDKPFWQELTTKTDQTIKVDSWEFTQNQTQTFVVKWTPKGKDKDGNWIVDREIVAIKMNIKIGGNEIALDSEGNHAPTNMKALLGKSTLTISKDFKVPNSTNTQTDDSMFAAWPKDGVLDAKGWKYTSVLNLGPTGSFDTTYTCTPDKGKKDKILVKATVTYKAPHDKANGKSPFTINSGNLSADKAEGVVVIDPKAGRIKSSEMRLDLKGTLTIDIGGMETTVDVIQNQTSTMTITDDDPRNQKK
jgi:hypothetical protein